MEIPVRQTVHSVTTTPVTAGDSNRQRGPCAMESTAKRLLHSRIPGRQTFQSTTSAPVTTRDLNRRRSGQLLSLCHALGTRGGLHHLDGQLLEAEVSYLEARQVAERIGATRLAHTWTFEAALVAHLTGRLDEAASVYAALVVLPDQAYRRGCGRGSARSRRSCSTSKGAAVRPGARWRRPSAERGPTTPPTWRCAARCWSQSGRSPVGRATRPS